MGFRMTSYYFLFVFDQLLQLLLKLAGVHVRALLLLAQKTTKICAKEVHQEDNPTSNTDSRGFVCSDVRAALWRPA